MASATVVLYLRVPPELHEQLQRLAVRALKLGRPNPGRQKHSSQSEAVRLLATAVVAELAATEAELRAPPDQLDMFEAPKPSTPKPGPWAKEVVAKSLASKSGPYFNGGHESSMKWDPLERTYVPATALTEPEDDEGDEAALSCKACGGLMLGGVCVDCAEDERPDSKTKAASRPVASKQEVLGPGALITIQWDPKTTRLARFVRYTKSGANAIVCIQRVNAKGKPIRGQYGEERSIAARDVLNFVSRRVA